VTDASFSPESVEAGGPGLDAVCASRAMEPRAADYVALLKPRVMSLVVFTGLVGLVLAPGHMHPVLAFTALLCIAIGAGASGAINMWYDADIDAIMTRTRQRPIPQGRIAASDVLGFGIVLSVASVMVMGLAANWAAAALLALTIGFYVFIYTMWLKRRTPQNIVIGGAAGAFPPMIGWAAVTGDIGLLPAILFGIIFMWTPPHFWALALYRSDDYARAGVPMLPVVAGELETRRQILLYSLLLVPLTLLPWWLALVGPVYGLGAVILGAGLLLLAVQIRLGRDMVAPRRMFGFSIAYLFLLFALLLVERGFGIAPGFPGWGS